jgi:SAM-dependent methyltransferase
MGVVFEMAKRFVASLRNRGIGGTIARISRIYEDYRFDKRYGIETVRNVELHTLSIEGPHALMGSIYQPTRVGPFRNMMATLNPPEGGVFVDFGCGKGRILLLASEYKFKSIVGVEFAPELCGIARRNIARYQKARGIQTEIRIFEGDAVDYPFRDDETVFYMNNPFVWHVMKTVLQGIVDSVERTHRRVVIIYNNPLYINLFKSLDFVPILEIEKDRFLVFSNAPLHPGKTWDD